MHPTLMLDWVVAGEIVASWVCLLFQASQGYACSFITCKCFSGKGAMSGGDVQARQK